MNLHPTVLAHVAFLERPRSWKDLIYAVSLIEERFSVLRERKRALFSVSMSSGSSSRSHESSRNVPRDRNLRRCWNCGRAVHLRSDCRRHHPLDSRWDLPSLEMDVKSGKNQSLWTRACENAVSPCQPVKEVL